MLTANKVSEITTSDFLTEQQISFFNKSGYLHIKGFVSRQDVQLFLAEMKRIEAHFIAENVDKINGTPIKYGNDETGRRIVQRFAFSSLFSPVLHEFLQDSRFLNLTHLLQPYEGRIGEEEKDGLVINHYVRTPESNFSRMGWHTDSPRDLFLGQRIRPMLNVGLHLDDCPMTNGGLRVLPGTHKQSTLLTLFRKRQFVDHRPDPREVGFDIEAGDLTIHNGSLWHRVQQSPHVGALSRRRVMYIPLVTGEYQRKTAASKTPFYHRLASKVIG
ncbi:phytanoyl-CoA dioxygenase family protein [Spirosoma aureum]|uniref:Phytanoyl-CoA dioxygenase family protein n=1 Tax=Spirosoma aureum TaxID=2692134 RepID=A0A6G9AMN8_9BACT|nr:phytanoyl-CoA dioxygenase family protein [Spirosoma aureum]QIP13463.1 phytanoyl-CoA dioxygenase family protein [Spirosoma aureum]